MADPIKSFHPFPEWECRARYAPDKGISNVWVNFYIGPMSASPDATLATVVALRGLADEIEWLLEEKEIHDEAVAITAAKAHLFPEGLVPRPGDSVTVVDVNSPEEDAAMDEMEANRAK